MRMQQATVVTPETRVFGIQGSMSRRIQAMLSGVARRLEARGVSVTGVIEVHEAPLSDACGGASLRHIETGACYRLYQDLGPGSTACCLDTSGVVEACQSVLERIPHSDVVILSKFGKLEAEHSGLIDAFIAAVEHRCTVLTSVTPLFEQPYLRFVGPLGAVIPPHKATLETCLRTVLKPSLDSVQ
jgi:hypothetical protein